MKLFIIALVLLLFVVACGPAGSLKSLNCAVDVAPTQLDALFSPLALLSSFTLTSAAPYSCDYSVGASPKSEVTLGVDVSDSSSETNAASMFARKRNAVSTGTNPNFPIETASKEWNQDLGFSSGWYAVQNPLSTTLNLHAIVSSGQEITLSATYYGDADMETLGSVLEALAQDVASHL